MILRLLLCFSLFVINAHADEVIWKGQVSSDGTPTEKIKLKLHDKYQIVVSGYINLGKWIQASEKLANDACFEFGENTEIMPPKKFECLKNSNSISVCDGKFHPNHIYQSEPFTATQNQIFFWVYDTNYDDNNGAFKLEIINLSK